MKTKLFVIMTLTCLALVLIAPVYATKPRVVDGVWFVWSLLGGATTGNNVLWTGNGTILHNNATYTWNLNRSPPGQAGSVVIGNVVTLSNLQFNTKTQKGNLVIKATVNFTSSNTVVNPYGIGVFECIAIVKVTAMNTKYPLVFGNGIGFILSTNGTGAFENAKLTADLVLGPVYLPGTTTVLTEGIFFGTHSRVNGTGTIIYHNPGQ